ncbi:MAG: DUF1579 family protein [Rhodoferax sp.]
MKTEAQKEHLWLKQLLGEWRFEGEAVMSPDERELSSQVLQADGSWKRFMTATYRRVKKGV